METIRRAWRGDLAADTIATASTDTVTVTVTDKIDLEPLIENYPYGESQTEYRGKIRYQEASIGGFSPKPSEYKFSYRDKSGLFLLWDDPSGATSREIFHQVNRQISDDQLVGIEFTRLQLWSFLFCAQSLPQLTVYNSDVDEFRVEEGQSDGFEVADTELDQSRHLSKRELAEEFSVKRATAMFSRGDSRIHVTYNDGSLSFTENASFEDREYVLQLFERYVIEGDVLASLGGSR